EMETLPKDRLKALQLKRLQTIVERAYTQNQFYRQLYDEANVKPSGIQSLEDIQKLPFLEKKTVRAAYPYGMAFVKPGGSGGAIAMDVMAIPMGSDARQYDRMIDFIVDFGVTAMCMTPSVGLYVGGKARERGVNFKNTRLKIGLFGAEPWPWETRLKLEELFNITAYDEFGMTEFLGPGMTCECETRDGMHAWADAFLVECINPDTGEWMEDGKDGELVWTWLTADGTAMIRYRSRDLSRLWWEERCACGRTHPKIAAIKGRSDDAVSIRGLIVFPSQVEAALVEFPETGANFRIVVDRLNR